MTDDVVASLAAELVAGDVGSARPLIDRLYELGDPRWRDLCVWLITTRTAMEEYAVPMPMPPGAGAEDPEDVRMRARRNVWRRLANKASLAFLVELHGVPDLGFVRRLAADLDVATITPEPQYDWGSELMAVGMAGSGAPVGEVAGPLPDPAG